MRQNRFKTFLVLFLSFLILALFFKPYHAHFCSHSSETKVTEHSADHHHDVSQPSHHHDKKSDCGSDCACPQHRVNGCNPMTALAKSDRFILLEIISVNHIEALFSAKQSPILDGPFQPPRV